ncbi:MAG: DUF3149 domain-containing protein [bacterium]
MQVLMDLFSDFTGWLTLAILAFIFGMMGYLFYLFITGGNKKA